MPVASHTGVYRPPIPNVQTQPSAPVSLGTGSGSASGSYGGIGNYRDPGPAAPPSQYQDLLGDIYEWHPETIGMPSETSTGVTPGKWVKHGTAGGAGGAGAGPAAAAAAPPTDEFDFDKWWNKVPAPPQVGKPAWVKGPGLEDRRAAESLQFGRAKDRIGKIGRGSMKSLENMFASRGISGSGHESAALGGAIGGMRGDLANVATEQALSALAREAQISDRDYAGNISQRGSDIGIDVGNADRTAENQRSRISLISTLLGKRPGTRLY